MKRFSVRALKWPFSTKDVDAKVEALESYLLIFSTAPQLNIGDQVGDSEQDRTLETLAYVGDAPFNSYENQRRRPCFENT